MSGAVTEIPGLDWKLLRQACGLALASQQDLHLKGGGDWLAAHPPWLPVFEDMVTLVDQSGLGSFDVETGDLFFKPASSAGYTLHINGGKFSSFVEMILFLAPWCFSRDFRTVLLCTGVSHGPLSLPTSFLRESLSERGSPPS